MLWLPSLAQFYLVFAQGRNLTSNTHNSGRYNCRAEWGHRVNTDQPSHFTDEISNSRKFCHAAGWGSGVVKRVDSGCWLANLPRGSGLFLHSTDKSSVISTEPGTLWALKHIEWICEMCWEITYLKTQFSRQLSQGLHWGLTFWPLLLARKWLVCLALQTSWGSL